MQSALPARPSRQRDPVSGAPSELTLTLRIPRTIEGLLAALEVEQSAYEAAKAVVSTLEEDRLDLAEQVEHEKSAILQALHKVKTWPSMAAQKRDEDDALDQSVRLAELENGDRGLRRALIRATEDTSVFRHRVLTLRSALDAMGNAYKAAR